MIKFTITCDHCGVLTSMGQPLQFFNREVAESSASSHVDENPTHVVIGTQPAHNHEGSIPVIVFTARKREVS